MQNENELIASFMGLTTAKEHGVKYWIYDALHLQSDSLSFDTSWDWLMPVVEKIATLEDVCALTVGFGGMVNVGMRSKYVHCEIENWLGGEFTSSSGQPKLIDTVYKSVVEFIKWYNNSLT